MPLKRELADKQGVVLVGLRTWEEAASCERGSIRVLNRFKRFTYYGRPHIPSGPYFKWTILRPYPWVTTCYTIPVVLPQPRSASSNLTESMQVSLHGTSSALCGKHAILARSSNALSTRSSILESPFSIHVTHCHKPPIGFRALGPWAQPTGQQGNVDSELPIDEEVNGRCIELYK